jgi:hypothetical protein
MTAQHPQHGPLDADGFRRAGHALIDWIADYRETIARRKPSASSGPCCGCCAVIEREA